MSIASEITRLQNAKASIKTSIENKGVTVPSATKLDGYSTLIDSIQTGITPTGTISITSNGTVDVTNYASAEVDVPTVDLSWLGSATPTPNVRNLFYDLANGTVEHGEFTLASTPTNTQVDLFTLQNITAPCRDIVFIDKAFYQGDSTLPNSDAIGFMWFSKSFLNPARETALGSDYPSYGFLVWGITQTSTAGGFGGTASANRFDNSTAIARGFFEWSGQTLKWRSQYGGTSYTTFIAGRTYIWFAGGDSE